MNGKIYSSDPEEILATATTEHQATTQSSRFQYFSILIEAENNNNNNNNIWVFMLSR